MSAPELRSAKLFGLSRPQPYDAALKATIAALLQAWRPGDPTGGVVIEHQDCDGHDLTPPEIKVRCREWAIANTPATPPAIRVIVSHEAACARALVFNISNGFNCMCHNPRVTSIRAGAR